MIISFNNSFNTPALNIPAHIEAAVAALLTPNEDAYFEALEAWDAIEGEEKARVAVPRYDRRAPEEWEGW